MAEQKPSYVVPPSRKPSFLNGTMLTGWAGGIAATAVTGIPFLPLIGLAAGSYFGKQKMEEQSATGKTVNPPKALNKGAAIGAVAGALGPLGLIVGGAALAASGAGLAIAGVAAVGLVGGFIGSKIHQHFQKKEYRAAENYVLQNGEFSSPREQAQNIAMGQEPELAQSPQQAKGAGMQKASEQLDPKQLAQLQSLAAQGQQMAPTQQESMTDKMAAQQRPTGPQQR